MIRGLASPSSCSTTSTWPRCCDDVLVLREGNVVARSLRRRADVRAPEGVYGVGVERLRPPRHRFLFHPLDASPPAREAPRDRPHRRARTPAEHR